MIISELLERVKKRARELDSIKHEDDLQHLETMSIYYQLDSVIEDINDVIKKL